MPDPAPLRRAGAPQAQGGAVAILATPKLISLIWNPNIKYQYHNKKFPQLIQFKKPHWTAVDFISTALQIYFS